MIRSYGARVLASMLAFALLGAPGVRAAPSDSATTVQARDPAAIAAYDQAKRLVKARDYDEAVSKLDYASELEPTWVAPVRLRAEVFATLADRYGPSAVFTAARAADLQRLVVLEPGVDTAARKHEIATLQQRSRKAETKEQRRRKLMTPAAVLITLSAGFLLAGVLLYSIKPTREALQPGAYRQERRDHAAIAMMVTGGALAPAAIAVGVLAFRQAKRDSVMRDFNVNTGRARPSLAVAPTLLRRGGGLGLSLRF